MTTYYLILVDGTADPVERVANKARAITKADAIYAADKTHGVTVTVEKSGTVVHEKIGVTVESKPRATGTARLDLSNLPKRENVKGYVHSTDDTHATPTTYNKGCRCTDGVEFEGRTISGCLGAMNEYDRWWRTASAAKKAGQEVPARPTFPAVPRVRKPTASLKGADRAEALQARLAANGQSVAATG